MAGITVLQLAAMFNEKPTDMVATVIVTTEIQLKAIIADAVNAALKYYTPSSTISNIEEPFGDFHWLRGTCPGIPASTLRIKSAAGEIPGVKKFGKRVLYEKSVVLDWLRGQTRQTASTAIIGQEAEEQFNRQLAKKGGSRA